MKKIYVTVNVEVGALGGAIVWCRNRGIEPRSLSDAVAMFLQNNCPLGEEEGVLAVLSVKEDAIARSDAKKKAAKPIREKVEKVTLAGLSSTASAPLDVVDER